MKYEEQNRSDGGVCMGGGKGRSMQRDSKEAELELKV